MTRREMLMATIVALGTPKIVLPSPRTPTVVTLRITPAEAQALANVLSGIGGDPHLSDRGHIDTIGELLREQGYAYQWGNCIKRYHEEVGDWGHKYISNVHYCRDYSEYEHVYPAGPGKPFQHSPDLRYLRRQRDGVKL